MPIEFNSKHNLYLPTQDVKQNPLNLQEVLQIAGGESQTLSNQNIENIIEQPLVEAVRILNFKNIPTITSSANGQNRVGDNSVIILNLTALSKANKLIAKKLVEQNLATVDKNYRDSGVDALILELNGEKGMPLAYNKVEKYFIDLTDKFIPQEKKFKELPLNEIEDYVRQMLGFHSIEEMYEEMTTKQIEENVQEIKGWFDWTDPFVGKKKE